MSFHHSITELYKHLGYTKKDEGICLGISLRWLEACLLGEEIQFYKRMLNMLNTNEIPLSINRTKAKRGINLTEEDIALLDLLAFFDSLTLFQKPREHDSLFNTPGSLNQNDIETVSYFASSDKIIRMGGLAKIYSDIDIYTDEEIKKYLDSLALAIGRVTSSSKETIALVLTSDNHAIALTYTPSLGWKFMDINQFLSKAYDTKQTNLLAKDIVTGFKESNSFYTAFNTSIFTTKNNFLLSSLKDELEQFKNSHVVTKEKAYRESNGINLAYMAAKNGYANVIAELAKHGVDLNQTTSNGVTLVNIAAVQGYANVIAELAKHGVDLNKTNHNYYFSMIVLGGFIAVVGIASVAIAFTLLHATTLGVAGLMAGIGIGALLSGAGLFATGVYKYRQTIDAAPQSMNDSEPSVLQSNLTSQCPVN